MQLPATSDGTAQREQRLSDKLERSPGSFFKARARDLVLAADYANKRLPENAYGGTSRRHYHTVCGATYTVLLSSFELSLKSLYARIIDRTSRYDDRLKDDKSLSIKPELILANREVTGAGDVFASQWNAWQAPDEVNRRFRTLMQVDPLDKAAVPDLEKLWQLRHVVAHSSGVTSRLDRHRLGGAIEADRALVIDGAYLSEVEARLLTIMTNVVNIVGNRLLDDFFASDPTGEARQDEYSALFLLGQIVGQTQDLPVVTEDDFIAKRADR
ncbi:MAG: hypothetical protein AB7V42_05510 [Thermoleophilia bacterium]